MLVMASLGIPVKLLHEALGHVITIEIKGGSSYRGKLFEGSCCIQSRHNARLTSSLHHLILAEDNLNVSLKEVTVTARDGKQSPMDSVYIRGSMIR